MIKLVDILKGTFHDPFTGEISEGLIKTVEVDKAIDIITKQFPTFDTFYEGDSGIRIEFTPKYLNSKLQNYAGNYPDPNISKILTLLNNLGYFPTAVQYDLGGNKGGQIKYDNSIFRDLILNQQPRYLSFIFEPKYDPVVEVPKYIYHITDNRYLDKIKQIGLKPRALNKRSTHESRIYFSLGKESSDALWSKLKLYIGTGKGVLLTVDTSNLDAVFYNDPNYDKLGVYTYNNIPPSSIIKYESITEN
jgi:predicted peptidase